MPVSLSSETPLSRTFVIKCLNKPSTGHPVTQNILSLPIDLRTKKMHPLEKFRYCPECGSPHFEVRNTKAKQCADCGFTYYFNPSAATVAFILNPEGKLLVCRNPRPPRGIHRHVRDRRGRCRTGGTRRDGAHRRTCRVLLLHPQPL